MQKIRNCVYTKRDRSVNELKKCGTLWNILFLVRERLFASKDGHKVTQYTKIEASWVENERRFSTALQTRQSISFIVCLILQFLFLSSCLTIEIYRM